MAPNEVNGNEIKLRPAVMGGYNKQDVEAYIDKIISDYDKEIQELKKRFQNAMKTVDEKDEKCYDLNTKISEMKVKLNEYEERSNMLGSSQENITQLLETLESTREEALQSKNELNEALEHISALKSELNDSINAISDLKLQLSNAKEEANEFEKSNERLKRINSELEKTCDDLRSRIEQLNAKNQELLSRPAPEPVPVPQQQSVQKPAEPNNYELMQELIALKKERDELISVNETLQSDNQALVAEVATVKAELASKPAAPQQAYGNLLADTIEQASLIVQQAKEEAANIESTLSKHYTKAYAEVSMLRDMLNQTKASVNITSDGIDKMLEEFRNKTMGGGAEV